MDDLSTQEVCDKCKEPFEISVEYFEQALKDGEPILCPVCLGKYLDEQVEMIPKRQFEYNIFFLTGGSLDNLGKDGWELVSVDSGIAYFKREYLGECDG